LHIGSKKTTIKKTTVFNRNQTVSTNQYIKAPRNLSCSGTGFITSKAIPPVLCPNRQTFFTNRVIENQYEVSSGRQKIFTTENPFLFYLFSSKRKTTASPNRNSSIPKTITLIFHDNVSWLTMSSSFVPDKKKTEKKNKKNGLTSPCYYSINDDRRI